MFNTLELTNQGTALLTAILTGHEIKFTNIKMGDGNKPSDVKTLTDIVSTKQTLDIARASVIDINTIIVGGNLMAYMITEGFYWKEIGLFAQDITAGTPAVLFSYGYADDPTYIPEGGTVAEMLIDLNVEVGNAENVNIEIDSSLIFVTKDELDQDISEVENNLNDKININKTTMDNHIANKNNPHVVTKALIGLGSVDNYGTATQAEATAGTSSQKFMTPQRVKQAVEAYSVISDGNLIIKIGGTQPSIQTDKTIIWVDTSS